MIKFLEINSLNSNDVEVFTNLYSSYVKKLSSMSKKISKAPVSHHEIRSIMLASDLLRYFITYKEEICGFVLLGINENKHPLSDYYIGEFYIKEDMQKKGIGKLAVKEMTKIHKGNYCCYILKNNIPAQNFWKQVFKNLGFSDLSKEYSSPGKPDDCDFYMFAEDCMKIYRM